MLWDQRLWVQLPLLMAMMSPMHANAQRSSQALVSHIVAKNTGQNSCVGTHIRYDRIETEGVTFTEDDDFLEGQVNRVMLTICHAAYDKNSFLDQISPDERLSIDSRARIINACEARYIDTIDRYGIAKSRIYRAEMFKYLSDIYLVISHVNKRYTATAITSGAFSLAHKGMNVGSDADTSSTAQMLEDINDDFFEGWKDSAIEQLKKSVNIDNQPNLPAVLVDHVCSK